MNSIILAVIVLVCCIPFYYFIIKKQKKEIAIKDTSPELTRLFDFALNPPENKVVMYALRTCRHCKKTKEFLETRNISFTLIYLDDFTGQKRSDLMDKVREYNPRGTFPVVLCPGGNTIVGYREALLKEAFPNDTK